MAETDRSLWQRILDADLESHAYTAERHDWPGAAVFSSPLNDSFNLAVVRHSSPTAADALLVRLVDHYRQLGVTPRVRVTPLSSPPDWPDRLRASGFVQTDDSELFFHLVGPVRRPPNPIVDVRLAPEEADVADFVASQMAGFGSADPVGFWVAQALRNRERGGYRFLVAYLDDEPVGAASARFTADTVGIYGVTTIETRRGRGVSTTLLHWVVDEARRRGTEVVFLSALPGSYAARLYESLGFAPLFTVDTYELPTS